MAANAAGAVFTVLLFIYLARVLEAEAFGYLSYAMTIVFYLLNFVDVGLSTYGIREVAKDRKRVSDYVSDIVSFKLSIASLIAGVFIILTFLLPGSIILKFLMAETALLLFVSALATEWAFQGMEMMHMVFISISVTTFLQLLLNTLLVREPQHLLRVPLINFLAAIPIIFIFLKRLNFRIKLKGLDFKRIRLYLSSSVMIWGISVFAQAYNNLDIVILGFFRRPEEVGSFTIARRFIGGVALLMVFLANAVLPHLSCTFCSDFEKFHRATKRFLKMAVIIIIFLLLPVIFFSGGLISVTVGAEYMGASIPLKIMAVALILVLFNLPFSTGLIAAGFEKEILKQAAGSATLSFISNFILIPRYGMIGAAVSFLLAEGLALAWILNIYSKKIERRK